MTTENNTIVTSAELTGKISSREARKVRRIEQLYKEASWLGKRSILVAISAQYEGDEDLFDIEEYIELGEALKYGEIGLSDYLKGITHMWAIACDFKPRERWPYFV
jgi:hypothetical protein